MKLYNVEYLSYCTVNKRLTNPMIPWIIAEIKKNNYRKKVNITNLFIILNFIVKSFIFLVL